MFTGTLLSTFDIARRGVTTPRTVQRWAAQGRISGTLKVGHEYRFEAPSVEAQFRTGAFPKNGVQHL